MYSGHTALSGRTDTRTSALLSEESMLFHPLPLGNETRTSSSETCLCLIPVSSLLTSVYYPGKPTFWRQHKNRLMGWLNVYLESEVHIRDQNSVRNAVGQADVTICVGATSWAVMCPSVIIYLNYICLLFLPNPPGSYCSSEG